VVADVVAAEESPAADTGYRGGWAGVAMRCALSSAPQRLFHSPSALIASSQNRAQASVPAQTISQDYKPRPHQRKRNLEGLNSRWRTAEVR